MQPDEASRTCISEESINDKDVAAAPHGVSRLLNPSTSLVTIVVLHCKRCTARKRATTAHTQVHRLVSLEEYGGSPTQAASLDRRSWALARDLGSMETRNRRIRRGQGTTPFATTGLRHAGHSDSIDSG